MTGGRCRGTRAGIVRTVDIWAGKQATMPIPQVEVVGDQAMLGELAALHEQVRQLTLERERNQQLTAGAGGSDDAGPADPEAVTAPTHIMTRLVHVAGVRPCPGFSGGPGEDAMSIEAWITEVCYCGEERVWTVAEQAIFFLDHLTRKVRCHPEPERHSPDQIFVLLLEHCCNSQSYVHSLAQSYQRSDEAIRQMFFTVALLTPGAIPNAVQIPHQLSEQVRVGALRRNQRAKHVWDGRLSAITSHANKATLPVAGNYLPLPRRAQGRRGDMGLN